MTIPVVPSGHMFGVDVGTSQAALDFGALAAAGMAFTIIKMGGGNAADSPYTAPAYITQVNRAREAGLLVGHYWFNGQKVSVKAQAEFFAANALVREGEILVLDIEAEDLTKTRAFTPAEAIEFTETVRLAFPGVKFLIYMSAYTVRSSDWSGLVARGHGLWVASYGANNGMPGATPQFNDWADYAIWQYSSLVIVPGWAGGLDGNLARDTAWADFALAFPASQTNPTKGDYMPLTNYILNGPQTVIWLDNRDPWVSWRHHLDRTQGLRGGVDLVARVGTPVLAPTDGVWTWAPNNGGAGNSGLFHHDANPGWKDVFSHLSRYAAAPGAGYAASGQHFKQGQVIGYTGSSGGVAEHLHRHLMDPQGRRQNPWNYFSNITPAGGVVTPLPQIPPAPERNKSMTTGYWTDRDASRPGIATDWALTDGGIWFPMGNTVAQDVAKLHGSFVYLTPASFAAYKKLHDAPAAATVSVDSAVVGKAVADAVAASLAPVVALAKRILG